MLDIEQTLKYFERLKVLIIGDVMLDEYIEGSVKRISPEAPVPVVEVKNKRYAVGGAANVALNIKALGATPILCSVIGKDPKGLELVERLEVHNISSAYLYQSLNRKTTCKQRVLAQGQQLLRIDEEDTQQLLPSELKEFLELVHHILEEQLVDVIIFQDYNKGILFPQTIRPILLAAIREDIPTVVDPKKDFFFEYKGVTLLKPNLREVNDQVPFTVNPTMDSLNQTTNYLRDRLRNQETLITLSEEGLFYANEEQHFLVPTTPRIIADVCGAGDTVVSIAALGVATQLDRRELAILCNLAGGQVCEKVGVVPINRNRLIQDYIAYYVNLQC